MPYRDEIKIIYKKETRNYDHPHEITEIPVLKWKYSMDSEDSSAFH